MGYDGGINLYSYTQNNPGNWGDPSGLYAGVDDAIFTVGGAIVGLAGQGISDLIAGKASGWENYAGSAIGGAAGGESLLYTGPIGAGAVGGAATSLSTQGLKYLTGKQTQFDFQDLAVSTTVGAATGLIPGFKIRGITLGRGNYNAIFKQMATKFQNGTISRVSLRTAGKMFVGRSANTGVLPGIVVGAAGSYLRNKIGASANSGCR